MKAYAVIELEQAANGSGYASHARGRRFDPCAAHQPARAGLGSSWTRPLPAPARGQAPRPALVPPARLQPLHHPLHRLARRPAPSGRGPVAARLPVDVEDVQLLPRVLQWGRPPVRRRRLQAPTISGTGAPPSDLQVSRRARTSRWPPPRTVRWPGTRPASVAGAASSSSSGGWVGWRGVAGCTSHAPARHETKGGKGRDGSGPARRPPSFLFPERLGSLLPYRGPGYLPGRAGFARPAVAMAALGGLPACPLCGPQAMAAPPCPGVVHRELGPAGGDIGLVRLLLAPEPVGSGGGRNHHVPL